MDEGSPFNIVVETVDSDGPTDAVRSERLVGLLARALERLASHGQIPDLRLDSDDRVSVHMGAVEPTGRGD